MTGWAVVGLGDIARRRVLPALHELCKESLSRNKSINKIRAVVSRDPEKARIECEKFGVERIYSTLEGALADPEVTSVYVATPVALHAPQTIAALAAGKHVLCEKPTAMDPAQVEAMIAAAKSAGRHFGVAFYRRFFPAVTRARELMRAGTIGQPTLVWGAWHMWFDEKVLSHRAWLIDPEKSGGGPLMDIGSHRIDLLNYLFSEPRLAGAAVSRQTHMSPEFKVEDNATLTLDYAGEFGAVRAVLDVRWNSHVPRDEFKIIGTEGEIDLSPLSSGRVVSPRGEEVLPPHGNTHYPMIKNFTDVLSSGGSLVSSGETALPTDRIIAEAYRVGGRS
jgi:predicted dehydrogenase